MSYAYDRAIPLPVKDLYDKQIMAMSINAAKDMYEKGQKQIDDFYEKYGDFISPIQKDMDWYAQNVTGKASDFINQLYANGIDPLRSAEGRAAVAQLIRSMPIGDIAKLRQSADVAKEYVKNYGALEAAGKLDPEFERFMMNGQSLQDWSTLGGNGIWGRYSPSEYKTLQEYVHPTFAEIKPHMMSEQEVKDRGYNYDPMYEYTGVSRADMERSMGDWIPGVRNEGIYRYYREQAKQDLIRRGVSNPTEDQIDRQFVNNAITADSQMMTPLTREANPFKLDDYRTANDIKAARTKAAIDHYYKTLEGGGGEEREAGYNVPEDVYVTTLAKGAGVEYLPKGGVHPNLLQQMINEAAKRQTSAIISSGSVLSATGMFISPEKVAGLIQADGKDGSGYFLNSGYFKNLHTIEDMSTSYKGWARKGRTSDQSKQIKKGNKQRSKDIISGINDWMKTDNGGYRLKVVPITDEHGNNTYSMVGDDGRWHTYARMRVYMSNGKDTKDAGAKRTSGSNMRSDIPKEGKEMVLEVGLRSNNRTGTPDLSISSRENLGFYGFDKTKDEIGLTGNSGFPYGTNILQH